MTEPLLRVRNLRKYFVQRGGLLKQNKQFLHAVDSVSFDIQRGETLGLVGESGCGKSTLGKTLLRLYEPDAGEIQFDGQDVRALGSRDMRSMRRRMQMIFQDPYDSLNARHTVGSIIEEPLLVHRMGNPSERRAKVEELLEQVGLTPDSVDRFPHEFSGGQRQRIGIARAIALNPDFVVCDEPLSALDVSVQAQIVNLLLKLRASMNLSLLFISHDLSVVRHLSDRVAVMYLGEIVEMAPAASIYHQAKHPYTRYLISSIPRPQVEPEPQQAATARADAARGNTARGNTARGNTARGDTARGEIPSPLNPPSGCRFHTRCPIAQDRCLVEAPKLEIIGSDNHQVACHFWDR